MVMVVVFIGTAGSGKSSLVRSFGSWIRRNLFLRVAQVNLDPGAEIIPYEPVFDIRDIFTLHDVMRAYNLGPNGGFIKASELIAEKTDIILSNEPFSNISEWDVVLIDTPGQMEAFIFRPASTYFFHKLSSIVNLISVYIIDGSAINGLSDAITLWFLGLLAQIKTGLLTVPVVNKIDIAENIEYARLLIEAPEKLIELAKKERSEGLLSDIAPELLNIALKTKQALRPVIVCAKDGRGMEELYYLVHEAFCTCGDLT